MSDVEEEKVGVTPEEKEIDVENAGNLDEKTYEQTTEIINEGGEAAFSC